MRTISKIIKIEFENNEEQYLSVKLTDLITKFRIYTYGVS